MSPTTRRLRFLSAQGCDGAVQRLLAEAGLPTGDLEGKLAGFFLAEEDGAPAGVVGVEVFGASGLLRSLAVTAPLRGRGIADALCHRALSHAQGLGVEDVYLLTQTAAGYFQRWGFRPITRDVVPAAVRGHAQFHSLCPSTATCMHRSLRGQARYFPRETLRLAPDVPGASFWAAPLERVALTYYEVEPHARFERHQHEGEQVTLVLEGELCFELDDRPPIRARPGEVVALPAGVPHAVYATDQRVKAVDGWSPVPRRYAGNPSPS